MHTVNRSSRITRLAAAGIFAAALLVAPKSAVAQDAGFSGRLWVGAVGRYVLNDNTPFASPGFGTVEMQVKGSSVGFGGDLEYRINPWFGIDGAVGYSNLNVQFTSTTAPGNAPTQGFGVLPIMAALNVHLVHSEGFDLFVGPQIAYVMFPDNLSFTTTGGPFTYKPANKFSAEGFVVGADIKMTKSMALNLAFRWQNADSDANDMLTIDPTFVTAGFRWKF
jgi:opacity protein-like surface antigen